jgi:hypothetical protein
MLRLNAKKTGVASMRKIASFALKAFALSILTTPAFAQNSTVGDRLNAAMTDMLGPLFFVIACASFGGGLFLLAKGMLKLKDASSGHNATAGEGLLIIMAAICLICLPDMAGVGIWTVFGADGMFTSSDLHAAQNGLDDGSGLSSAQSAGDRIARYAQVQAPQSCIGSSAGSGNSAVTCMAQNIAQNAIPIGVIAVFAAAFIGGLFVFASCLFEMSKGDRGGQTPAFWGKAVGSVLLMNGIYFFVTSTNTLLGSGQSTISTNGVDANSSMLSYTAPSGMTGSLATYAQLIGYCFVILTFFGAFAFVKGLFIIKDASENKGQAQYSHGIVFAFAGILLANAKYTVCLVLSTVAGSGNTSGFC